MKAVSRTLVVCIALASSLAQAEDRAGESHLPFQVLVGAVGAVALTIPAGYAGYQIGDFLLPPQCSSGEPSGCDTWYPYGGVFGMVIGGFAGITLGSGLGVATAGYLVGRPFQLWPSLFGGLVGALVAVAGAVVIDYSLEVAGLVPSVATVGPYLIPALTIAGAIAGSIVGYEVGIPSLPSPTLVNATPMVWLVPGGGVAGITGTF